jgi:hypothetical protein
MNKIMKTVMHYYQETTGNIIICLCGHSYMFDTNKSRRSTPDKKEVTCKKCLKRLKKL